MRGHTFTRKGSWLSEDGEEASRAEELSLKALGDVAGKKQRDAKGVRMSTTCRSTNPYGCLETESWRWMFHQLL